jgi:hypothetical protein
MTEPLFPLPNVGRAKVKRAAKGAWVYFTTCGRYMIEASKTWQSESGACGVHYWRAIRVAAGALIGERKRLVDVLRLVAGNDLTVEVV